MALPRPVADELPAGWGFYALGVLSAILAVGHLLTEGEGLGTALEGLVLLALAGAVLFNGYDVGRRDLSRRGGLVALGLTVLFVASFVLLATALVLIWLLEHGHVHDARFIVLFAGLLGAAVGGRATVYAMEFREALRRNEELTKLLRVNQRVLRHNLRNEVTIVLGYLESVDDANTSSGDDLELVRRHLDDLLETSQTARRIVEIWERDAFETFDLATLVADRVGVLHETHPDADVAVDCAGVPSVRAHVSLPRAVDEALENAVVHNHPDVEIEIGCERTADGVTLSIADTGSGIPAVETEALFQPAETALEHGEGLGLWLLYWTVRKSEGTLTFRERDGGGTVVEIVLPPAD